jgi:hypothetical protein
MEILLLEENGYMDLRQGIGHLINAIVAVLGPELAPGSTFFSRCKVELFLLQTFPFTPYSSRKLPNLIFQRILL